LYKLKITRTLIIFLLLISCTQTAAVPTEPSTTTTLSTTTTTVKEYFLADNFMLKNMFQPGLLPMSNFSPFILGPDCWLSDSALPQAAHYYFDPSDMTFVVSNKNMLLIAFKAMLLENSEDLIYNFELEKPIQDLEEFIEITKINFFRVKISYDTFLFDKNFNPSDILYLQLGETTSAGEFDYLKIPILISEGKGLIEYYVYFTDGSFLKSSSNILISEDSIDICIENNSVDINGDYAPNRYLVPIRIYNFNSNSWNSSLNSAKLKSASTQTKEYVSFEDNVKAFEEAAFGDNSSNELDIDEFKDKLNYVSSSNEIKGTEIGKSNYETSFYDLTQDIDSFDLLQNFQKSSALVLTQQLYESGSSWWGTFENSIISIEQTTAYDFKGYLDNEYFEFKCASNGGYFLNYGAPESLKEVAFSFCSK